MLYYFTWWGGLWFVSQRVCLFGKVEDSWLISVCKNYTDNLLSESSKLDLGFYHFLVVTFC